MQCCAMLCNAVLCYAVQVWVLCFVAKWPCSAMLCHAVPCIHCSAPDGTLQGVRHKRCAIQAPGHMASPSASPQGQGPAVTSPAASQSSPQQPLTSASDPPQAPLVPSHPSAEGPAQSPSEQGGGESDQQLLPDGTAPSAHDPAAAQHAQHAGQGSGRHGGQNRRQGQQRMGHSYQHLVSIPLKFCRSLLQTAVCAFTCVCICSHKCEQCLSQHVCNVVNSSYAL